MRSNAVINRNAAVGMVLLLLLAAGTAALEAKTRRSIPRHPTKLSYDSLDWEVPLGAPFRHELSNGTVVYVATDSTLPMVKVTAYVRYGALADPPGKEGLAALYATVLRGGGTKKFPADTLEELCDLLALRMRFSAAESQLTFSASFLSEYSSNAFEIIRELFFYPVFNKKKLAKERTNMAEALQHRFDNPGPTLAAAFKKQWYRGQAASRLATPSSLASITRKDLLTLHNAVFSPGNIIFCIAGAFNSDSMITHLETLLNAPVPSKPSPQFPPVTVVNAPHALMVHSPISQAYVRLGLPLFQRPHPDYYAITLLNKILGGGGFSSRLGQTVRSDAGLTYSIYSSAQSNYTYPGTFYISFFTKNQSFAHAVSLSLKELQQIVDSGITRVELDNARAALIGELPSMFRAADDVVSTYGWNEFFHRSPDHYAIYPKKLMSITRDDLLRVARTYLSADSICITVVGDTTTLLHQRHNKFSLAELHPKIITPDSISALP